MRIRPQSGNDLDDVGLVGFSDIYYVQRLLAKVISALLDICWFILDRL